MTIESSAVNFGNFVRSIALDDEAQNILLSEADTARHYKEPAHLTWHKAPDQHRILLKGLCGADPSELINKRVEVERIFDFFLEYIKLLQDYINKQELNDEGPELKACDQEMIEHDAENLREYIKEHTDSSDQQSRLHANLDLLAEEGDDHLRRDYKTREIHPNLFAALGIKSLDDCCNQQCLNVLEFLHEYLSTIKNLITEKTVEINRQSDDEKRLELKRHGRNLLFTALKSGEIGFKNTRFIRQDLNQANVRLTQEQREKLGIQDFTLYYNPKSNPANNPLELTLSLNQAYESQTYTSKTTAMKFEEKDFGREEFQELRTALREFINKNLAEIEAEKQAEQDRVNQPKKPWWKFW